MSLSDQDSNVSVDHNIIKFFPKSFHYFKLGMLFYILCKIKSIITKDKQFELFNKIEEFSAVKKDVFDKIQDYIFIKENPLIYTYYYQLPNIFLPVPIELIYYRPYVSFYKNNKSSFIDIESKFKINELMYNFSIPSRIKIDENNLDKRLFRFLQPPTEFPSSTTMFIPIDKDCLKILSDFTSKHSDVIYIMYYDNTCFVAKNNGSNIFNLLYKKEREYIKINRDITLDISKLQYITAMIPITRENIYECFDTDILPKDSLLYHNTKSDFSNEFPIP